jgi:hypothetical protein
MATYLEIIEKLQNQTLDNVKKLQAVQIATLTTVRELISELPKTKGMPTFAEITDLGNSFTNQLLDQQKAFVNELADAVKPPAELNSLTKSSTN